ncbi:hypothetical protein A4H97_02315 [Niastella yeongjuensis]|uniref:Uncharacterized protein n=1 Tax=Niastella yeongjuensis TaxID=354355 RepID=A0A1V9EXM7_9BACT|nr:hypothetical protein [Niastella yeongjuensis]OQP50695.1 hypothetical protein A4H97_02315 [Niastella yeongjuensis]SEN22326.1 hypothetical protein SAMN05660816_00481 [Niastella yeongjuensis]
MRSCNNHPLWHNQPLRLTDEERNNPFLVFQDFFESFHLNDVREQLWNWLIEVVSSPNSISSEPLERSNHFYLYEKIEAVIEACYIIRNQEPPQLQNEEEISVVPV